MTFRTESEIIRAVNQSCDLSNLVRAYLEIWKKHANGLNSVSVPSGNYSIVFRTPTEGRVNTTIVSTQTRHWEEPTYYDVDSDYFSESYGGSSNVSGYTHYSEPYITEDGISIPVASLLRSVTDMELDVKVAADGIRQTILNKQKADEIETLEKKLKELMA